MNNLGILTSLLYFSYVHAMFFLHLETRVLSLKRCFENKGDHWMWALIHWDVIPSLYWLDTDIVLELWTVIIKTDKRSPTGVLKPIHKGMQVGEVWNWVLVFPPITWNEHHEWGGLGCGYVFVCAHVCLCEHALEGRDWHLMPSQLRSNLLFKLWFLI